MGSEIKNQYYITHVFDVCNHGFFGIPLEAFDGLQCFRYASGGQLFFLCQIAEPVSEVMVVAVASAIHGAYVAR